MFLGIGLVVLGLLLAWQISSILGAIVLIGGVLAIGRQYMEDEPKPEKREYSSEAQTYTLRSSYKRKT